ncbi:MAG: cell division protein FtsZ [Synergistaceae bacterium]|nr:cell division protein FtsZ [Synergistaceae bacterium]
MANSALVMMEDNSPEPSDNSSAGRTKKRDNVQPASQFALRERIKVIGVGGGGNNALDHIIRTGATGVEFLAINTDTHCLEKCLSVEKLMLGERLTKGHGAGAMPEVGEQAALESRDEIRACLKGCDMVYLAAGMGGGTGTGALPIIAGIAREMGILTVSVVTRPFSFEGKKRKNFAEIGIEKLKQVVDALIVVPNDKLLQLSERTTSLTDAFAMADNVLRQAVQGVTDLVTKPGIINVDFADLRSIMKHAGGAVMGIGMGSGEHRAKEALRRAMESPLMENSMQGAKGVILNVTAGSSVGIMEVEEAANHLHSQIDEDANFMWGLVYDETMGEDIQMVVIATGFLLSPAAEEPSGKPENKSQTPPGAERDQQDVLFSMDSPLDTPSYLRRKQRR